MFGRLYFLFISYGSSRPFNQARRSFLKGLENLKNGRLLFPFHGKSFLVKASRSGSACNFNTFQPKSGIHSTSWGPKAIFIPLVDPPKAIFIPLAAVFIPLGKKCHSRLLTQIQRILFRRPLRRTLACSFSTKKSIIS